MPELTDLSYLKELCKKYGFTFAKGYGQNFIVNAGICPKICEAADIDSNSNVLEIGPGFGTLTRELAARAKKVVAVEIDRRLIPVLGETLKNYNNVVVVSEDIMKCDIAALLKKEFDGPVVVCANLPYYITSPIIMRLLEERLPISHITAMVQQEAAERIAAKTGTRAAGAITYGVHYYARPKVSFKVQPGSFYPMPKVTSAVLRLDVNPVPALAHDPQREKNLFRMVKAGFSQRRKTLNNALSAGLALPKDTIGEAQNKAGIAPKARPEEVDLAGFIRLEEALFN